MGRTNGFPVLILMEQNCKWEGLEGTELCAQLEAVDSDISNLEEELMQREELLKFIDSLIAAKKKHSKLQRVY